MKERQSNIELLRIIAMFLVLLVHADFYSLGVVTPQDIRAFSLDSVLKVFFEAISINCVDIFVLISGWFGIRASFKGGCKFLFQCFFFLSLIYVITLLLGISKVNAETIKYLFVATKWNWFIKAYLLLYIISPVLNAFVDHASKRQFAIVLLSFYAFQFFYGWIFTSATGYIVGGYSVSSFIGLYLLARYINVYDCQFKSLSVLRGWFICLAICCMVTVLYITPSLFNVDVTFMGGAFFVLYLTNNNCLFFIDVGDFFKDTYPKQVYKFCGKKFFCSILNSYKSEHLVILPRLVCYASRSFINRIFLDSCICCDGLYIFNWNHIGSTPNTTLEKGKYFL